MYIRKLLLLFYILFAISCSIIAKETSVCKVTGLRCEYLDNPLGIDTNNPRLSWYIEDCRKDVYPYSYQVVVGKDSMEVLEDVGSHWITPKIHSDKSVCVYEGIDLNPFMRYYWKVNIWNEEQHKIASEVHWFETGMMDVKNWQGTWISDREDINYLPAPYFRKQFSIDKPIKSARAYIAVAGLYELYLNGEKVGNHRLDPMYTRFDRRTLYVTHDVTSMLHKNSNAIGVILGNGWYNHQSMGVWDFERASWRNRPTFCLDLRITYEDGSVETITSGADWKTASGPILFNSIYTAEHYDFRLEEKEWATTLFDDSDWKRIKLRAAPSMNIVSQQLFPVRNVNEIKTKSMKELNDTTYLFDFGRNMAGVIKFHIKGNRGTKVRLIHGERLGENGHIDLSNINVYHKPVDESDPFQTDILFLSGEEDVFMPRFNYKGFRYVEVVSDQPLVLTPENLTAYFMHSDVPKIGYIHTSNELINKLCLASDNSYLSNLMGYPTDCPQREKNGWTGDGHLAIETALYNFDAITIYEKWLADHRDEMQPNGVLPDIIPTGGWGYGTDNGVDWTSTIAIIPWNIYLFYGDSKLLEDCYDYIKRYVSYIDRMSPEGLTSWGRGDWVSVKSRSSLELTSSVYFYVDTRILADAAKLFDYKEDYEYYTKLAEKIRSAINKKYFNPETGIYASGTQTELSVPLQWGIVPDMYKYQVAEKLAEKVKHADYHLDVGVLGAKAILNALSENGQAEVAYKVATQDTYPSWGHWIVNGATTLLENWDLQAERDISDNHMMFGEVGGWFFKGLGGLKPDPECPGFKHIILRPNFIKELELFDTKFQSPYGEIVSCWEYKKDKITYIVKIPANTTATLYLPENIEGERVQQLPSGEHTFYLNPLN